MGNRKGVHGKGQLLLKGSERERRDSNEGKVKGKKKLRGFIRLNLCLIWDPNQEVHSEFSKEYKETRCVCVCVCVCGYVWVCMGIYGCVCVCIGMYEYVWVCMGMYGYVWVCIGMYGYL